jgi:hypothetical protein
VIIPDDQSSPISGRGGYGRRYRLIEVQVAIGGKGSVRPHGRDCDDGLGRVEGEVYAKDLTD